MIYYDSFIASLKSLKKPAPVYFIKGNSDFLISECWRQLVGRISELFNRKVITARYSLKDVVIDDLIEILSTMPMGGIFRAILLNDLTKADKKNLHRFMDSFKGMAPLTCLVIVWNDIKGMAELEQKIEKMGGEVVSASAPRVPKLPAWVKKHVFTLGKKISDRAANLLIQYAGNDLWVLHNEIEKLILFVGNKKSITEEDVLNVASERGFYSIFELIDHLSQENYFNAISSLQALIKSGESPLAILGLISRHIRLLWQIKSALDENLSRKEIADIIDLPDFVLRRMIVQSQNISEDKLKELHQLIVYIDLKLKTTSLPPEHLFLSLIFHSAEKQTQRV